MLKKLLALVLAGAMVIGSALPAMATTVKLLVKDTDTYDESAKYYQLDNTGAYTELTLDATSFAALQAGDSKFFVDHDPTITIKSPILEATYLAYKVFDMTMDESGLNYSYTIDTNSPFYETVAAYAAIPGNGLVLQEIATATQKTVDNTDPDNPVETITYQKFNVTASTTENPITVGEAPNAVTYGNFDAQKFGQELEAKILDGTITATAVTPDYEEDEDGNAYNKVTVATSDELIFKDGIDLGYYLILAGIGEGRYPEAEGTVTVGPAPDDPSNITFTLTDDQLEDEAAIATQIENYVNAVVVDTVPAGAADGTKSYIQAKIDAANNGTGAVNSYGDPLTKDDPEYAKFVEDLKASLKADTEAKVTKAIADYTAKKNDINVKVQRLVFVDSTNPDVEIVEKNELDKWDVPVSPDGHADNENLPEHGEPDGGKNIILKSNQK